MTVGTRISDMVSKAALVAGDLVPIVSGGQNYSFDLGGSLAPLSVPFASISTITIGASVNIILTAEGWFFRKWTNALTALPTIPTGTNQWWRQSLDGAKWYPELNHVSYRQLGAKGDYVYATKTVVTDDLPAFLAYRQLCEWARIDNDNFSSYAACPKLFVEPGNYYHSARLDLDFGTVLIEAPYIGSQNGGNPVVFTAASGVGGAKLFYASESARSGAVGAMGSILRGIKFRSHGVGGDTTVNGILVHAVQTWIDHCSVEDFPGHGLAIIGNTGGSPATNANLCRVSGGNYRSNGYNGVGSNIFLQGNDGNQITLDGVINSYGAAQWGLDDESFLGDLQIAPHTDSNGVIGAGTRNSPQAIGSLSTFAGNHYAVTAGLATTAKTQQPGTGTAWTLIGVGAAGGSFPTWVSGTTYCEGGAYRTNNPGGFPTLLHPYSEGTQGPAQYGGNTLVIGGLPGAGQFGGGTIAAVNGRVVCSAVGTLTANTAGQQFGAYLGFNQAQGATDVILGQFGSDGSGGTIWNLLCTPGNSMYWTFNGGGGTSPFRMEPSGGAHAYSLTMAQGATIGSVFVDSGAAAPTTVAHVVGDYRFNDFTSTTKERGWRCTVAGTPGTFETDYRDFYGSVTVDLASIANTANSAAITITVTGAAVGDIVNGVSTSDGSIPLGCIIHGQVTAANTVKAFILNNSGGAYDPPSATYRAKVTRQ